MTLVVVSGLPGAGKTTVAQPLAAALGLPLLAKDTIKEALFDALGTGDRAWSKRLGGASMEVLFALAADAPAAVLESFWRRPFAVTRLRALGRPIVEVHCACPPELALVRYRERAATDRHPGHVDVEVGDDEVAGWAVDVGPLDLGGPVLVVDSSVPVDVAAVAAWVRQRTVEVVVGR